MITPPCCHLAELVSGRFRLVENINDLSVGRVVVVGTMFKTMKLKPSVLDEFSFEVLANAQFVCVCVCV